MPPQKCAHHFDFDRTLTNDYTPEEWFAGSVLKEWALKSSFIRDQLGQALKEEVVKTFNAILKCGDYISIITNGSAGRVEYLLRQAGFDPSKIRICGANAGRTIDEQFKPNTILALLEEWTDARDHFFYDDMLVFCDGVKKVEENFTSLGKSLKVIQVRAEEGYVVHLQEARKSSEKNLADQLAQLTPAAEFKVPNNVVVSAPIFAPSVTASSASLFIVSAAPERKQGERVSTSPNNSAISSMVAPLTLSNHHLSNANVSAPPSSYDTMPSYQKGYDSLAASGEWSRVRVYIHDEYDSPTEVKEETDAMVHFYDDESDFDEPNKVVVSAPIFAPSIPASSASLRGVSAAPLALSSHNLSNPIVSARPFTSENGYYVEPVVDEANFAYRYGSFIPDPGVDSHSIEKERKNLLFSFLSTLGAAAVALGTTTVIGLSLFGILNAWNPVGWVILGVGVAIMASSAVGLASTNGNLGAAWLALLPGLNMLWSIKQLATKAYEVASSSVKKMTKNLLLSGVATLGAASTTLGAMAFTSLSLFGALNFWNPVGWTLLGLGAAFMVVSAISLSKVNESRAAGLLPLFPGLNMLWSIGNWIAGDRREVGATHSSLLARSHSVYPNGGYTRQIDGAGTNTRQIAASMNISPSAIVSQPQTNIDRAPIYGAATSSVLNQQDHTQSLPIPPSTRRRY